MDYPMSAGDAPENPKPDAQPDAPAAESPKTGEKQEAIHIASDMLPPGMKEGDMLKCTGMDENGCQFELVKGEHEGKGEDWESGFRKEMSALTPSEEAS